MFYVYLDLRRYFFILEVVYFISKYLLLYKSLLYIQYVYFTVSSAFNRNLHKTKSYFFNEVFRKVAKLFENSLFIFLYIWVTWCQLFIFTCQNCFLLLKKGFPLINIIQWPFPQNYLNDCSAIKVFVVSIKCWYSL